MALKNLDDLFTHFMRDMYYAERQVLKSLPKMARKANSDELRQAFESHERETEQQIENLEKVFEMMNVKPRGITCEAMNGILDESKDIMDEVQEPDALDAGMIAAAQAVEHYEITRYGTMIAWAKALGKNDAAKLLEQNLKQEEAADRKLTEIAERRVNRKAA